MSNEECFELFRMIRMVGNGLSRERDEDLRSIDLTSNQSTAILYLDSNPGCQISDLSNHLRTSHQAACTLVERLKAKGLVDVSISDSDGRAKSVSLTADGREKCAEILRIGGSTASEALSVLSPDERRQLANLLDKVSDNLRDKRTN